MDDNKKSFIFYDDWKDAFALLSAEDQGHLIMSIFSYRANGVIPELSGAVGMAFSFIRSQIDRDSKKYSEKCEKNRENGAKGGRPRKTNLNENQTDNIKTARFFEKPKKADTDNDDENVNGNDKKSPKPPKGIDERFKKFWSAYPRKVGKGAAEKAFIKYKPDDGLLDTMLKAIEAQEKSKQWQKDGGQFIPNPSTWLNQQRWKDEVFNISPRKSNGKEVAKDVYKITGIQRF